MAVFHFVRQQYGWVALYRRKLNETADWTWWIDAAAIYLASIYPLAFWMTRLPRNFEWFVKDDFISIPAFVETVLFPIYVAGSRRLFREVDLSLLHDRISQYRQGYRRRDDGDLLVCRDRGFQFRLRVHGDKRDHPRRAVFRFDLFLRRISARDRGPRLPNAFTELANLFGVAVGDRIF